MEVFKISLNPVPVQRRAKRLLDIAMKLPKLISYDYYLNNLEYKKATLIDDIDQFICFTDISDSYLLARLIREKKQVKVYVQLGSCMQADEVLQTSKVSGME
jgi:hypothetical protein